MGKNFKPGNKMRWYQDIRSLLSRLWYSLTEYKLKKTDKQRFIEEALQRGLQGPVPLTELERFQSLLDTDLLSDNPFYIFEIPVLDGQGRTEFCTVSPELNSLGTRVLENQNKLDELVESLTSKLGKLPDIRKVDEARVIANQWPILVELGGEIVSLLIAVLQKSEDITTQVMISQLLGDIARDTSARLSQQIPDLLCSYCFVRCVAHDIKISWATDLSPLPTVLTYYGCRTCGQSRKFLRHTGSVVVVLDKRMEEHYTRGELLKVNWLIQKNVFDFDKVEIVHASDEEVERFAIQVGNDMDEIRQPRYNHIPCLVSANCSLSQNSVRILQRTFGQVSIE